VAPGASVAEGPVAADGPVSAATPGDALTPGAIDAAIRSGARAADEEVDSGADLLIAAAAGSATPSADVVVSIMALVEPVKVVGLSTNLSDPEWMTWVAEVRDARVRGLPHRHEVAELLACVGDLQLAALTGFVLRAAARRTPVLLDGVAAAAAALLAREVAPNVVRWWHAGAGSTRPAHALALEEFAGVPILDLRLRVDDGIGAVLAVQLLRAAARAVSDLTAAAPDVAEPGDLPVDDDAT
jgi:nicotinate-nucleotide--dimethylbenzimidazole phosphoribosyltransferase